VVAQGSLVHIAGTATDPEGVQRLRVAIQNLGSGHWLRHDGSWGERQYQPATLTAAAGSRVTWQFLFVPPLEGEYKVLAVAQNVSKRLDSSPARVTFPVHVMAQPGPVARFTADVRSGPAPHVVRFVDRSTAPVTTRVWVFGDGTLSTARHPIHTYLTPGTYTVRLTVAGPNGMATKTFPNLITVSATPPPPPPGPIAEFVALCPFSHRLADDPIVFPHQPGQSHTHSFFGSTGADAHATVKKLLTADTTCEPVEDRSAYWVPTLWQNGLPVEPEESKFYYLSDHTLATMVRPFPLGLRILAGNARRTGPNDGPSRYKWSCLGAPDSSTGDFVTCPLGSKLELLLNFPDCWNGSDLDSPDHKSHMAYSTGGVCPATHPVPVPQLQHKLRYPSRGGPGVSLSVGAGNTASTDGRGYTAHGDFLNAWEPATLAQRVTQCLHPHRKCNAAGIPE
jgi:PKD repeat protein